MRIGIKNKIYCYKQKKLYKKYKVKPASTGLDMDHYVEWIKTWSTLHVNNIFEIGANYGQDAERLRVLLGVKKEDVYIFEAHPSISRDAERIYKFNTFNNAVYNEEKTLSFNIVDDKSENTGISSIKSFHGSENILKKTINVASIRMDDWMDKNQITKIDFLKIDVEGSEWEVLDGFGEKLKCVSAIQLEAEHLEFYRNAKLWPEIEKLLLSKGFELVMFERHDDQSDSLWIRSEYIKIID